MTYTRQAFRAWLETLPADEKFSKYKCCPISTFLGPTCSCGRAEKLDRELTQRIDRRGWMILTPREVLTIMDKLQ